MNLDQKRTATMSQHTRRILTPAAPPSRKRKEMESQSLYSRKPPTPPTATAKKPSKPPSEPVSSNWLLAGYMAHEFLSKGTLLGQKWDPTRAEVALASNDSEKLRRSKPAGEAEPSRKGKEAVVRGEEKLDGERYAEVARLLKDEGAHVAGIVNPTQLARWIHQM